MKSNIHFLLMVCALAILPLGATATVVETNTYQDYIKRVTLHHDIQCGQYYEYEFSCEHNLMCGESMAFYDYQDGDCSYVYSAASIILIPCSSLSVTGSGLITTGVNDPSATVTLSMGGTAAMADVTLGSSNTGRFTVTELSRDVGNRTITVRVTGVAETPTSTPSGDALIKGLLQGAAAADGPNVLVLVPTTQSQSAESTLTWANASSGSTTIHLETSAFRNSIITIKDQFGNVLTDLWNGSLKVDEQFFNTSGLFGSALTTSRVPISYPLNDQNLTNGIKKDQCGLTSSIDIPASAVPDWNAGDWAMGWYFLVWNAHSGFNVIQYLNGPTATAHAIGDQKLWVWNTALTNMVRRDLAITGTQPPTISLSYP